MPWFRASRRRTRTIRLGLEDLEPRRLLSTSASAAGLANPSFDSLTGAAQVRQQDHVDGSGFAAAVIGTGVNYDIPALGGGFGPGHKVEAGYDFAQDDPDPMAETSSHGTMVAGLIASDAPGASGVAPGAEIVPLRVIGNDGQGSYQGVADALQWVVANHGQYHITVVNISLSDGGNYTSDPFTGSAVDDRIQALITQLDGLDVPVVCAAGNSFDGTTQGMGYTAIVSGTVSVTGTDPQDHLVSDAQRLGAEAGGASATDLAAPGSGLLATDNGNALSTVEGTSFAAPLVSGAVILLQQIYQSRFGTLPSVSDLVSWLKQGSDPITDPATGITIGRLDIPKAASLIPQPDKPVETPGTPPSTPPSDETTTPPVNQPADHSAPGGGPASTGDTSSGRTAPPVPSQPVNQAPSAGSKPDQSPSDNASSPSQAPASSGSSVAGSTATTEDGGQADSDVTPAGPNPSPASDTTSATGTLLTNNSPAQTTIAVQGPSQALDQTGLSPTPRTVSLELRRHWWADQATEGHRALSRLAERRALMRAFRERRQLFRLVRPVSARSAHG